MLKAEIAKAEAHIRALTDRINELDEDVGRWKKDQKSATDIREKEAADYSATLVDLEESLAALDQAIAVLKERSAAVPQALLQVRRLKLIGDDAKSALDTFL